MAIKFVYLVTGYDFSEEFVNALTVVLPLIQLDMEMTKILEENEIFKYMQETYWFQKKQEETTLATVVGMIKDLDLNDVLKELQNETLKIKELVN